MAIILRLQTNVTCYPVCKQICRILFQKVLLGLNFDSYYQIASNVLRILPPPTICDNAYYIPASRCAYKYFVFQSSGRCHFLN